MKHRGKHPNDNKDFAMHWFSVFLEAAKDFSFLLGRDYGEKSALELVGNRYQLNKRQQRALSLVVCASDKIEIRKSKAILAQNLEGKNVFIDGYNLLINLEVALSGGFVLVGQDDCYRDMASVHGTYKKVEETLPAIELIDRVLKELKVQHAQWYFDAPVSNSGQLKSLLYEWSTSHLSNWDIELVYNPDTTLVEKNGIIISCDGWILDRVERFFDLAGYIIQHKIPKAQVLNFFL